MESAEEREAQPVLEEPCPRCGAPVVLRNWKGHFFTKCRTSACSFGYDADDRGHPVARCPVCGTGRMRTIGTDSTCADCGAPGRPGAARERAQAGPAHPPGPGVCPRCRKGRLAVHPGSYGTFVSCSERCGLTYSSDAQGVPEGGTCRTCRGPVRITRNGSRVCAVCGAWQEEERPAGPGVKTRPAQPKAAHCPRCSRPLTSVFTKRRKWMYRCDACAAWFDA